MPQPHGTYFHSEYVYNLDCSVYDNNKPEPSSREYLNPNSTTALLLHSTPVTNSPFV